MIFGIDGRSLLDLPLSGVGEYTSNLIPAMQTFYPHDEFRIFLNEYHLNQLRFNKFDRMDIAALHSYENASYFDRIPSKILNVGFLFGVFKMEKFLGKKVEQIFLPNHIFFSTKIPFTITVHDLSFHFFPEFYGRKGRLWHNVVGALKLYKKAKHIIAISKSTKQDLLQLGIPEEKIRVIYSGIHADFIQFLPTQEKQVEFRQMYQIPERYILYLGTVEKRKNVLGILQAFEILKQKKEMGDLFFLIAGKPGFGFQEIRKAYEKNLFKHQIRFLGYIPPEIKPYLYQGARVFVYPSFYEGFGFPPLEAMSIGIPVVVSNTSSLPEITRDAAIHVDPFSVRDLSDAIELLLQDSPLRDIMIERGRELTKEYTWERAARETVGCLKK